MGVGRERWDLVRPADEMGAESGDEARGLEGGAEPVPGDRRTEVGATSSVNDARRSRTGPSARGSARLWTAYAAAARCTDGRDATSGREGGMAPPPLGGTGLRVVLGPSLDVPDGGAAAEGAADAARAAGADAGALSRARLDPHDAHVDASRAPNASHFAQTMPISVLIGRWAAYQNSPDEVESARAFPVALPPEAKNDVVARIGGHRAEIP